MKPIIDHFGKRIVKKGIFLNRNALNCRIHAQDGRSAVILQYHSVRPPGRKCSSYVHPSLSISMDAFDRQVAFLRHHFQVVTLEKLLAYVKGDCNISGLPVAITFDDGYQDNYLYAFPVLLKHGVPAMFYLTTDCIDTKKPLWTSELRYIILKSPKSFLNVTLLSTSFSIETAEKRLTAIQQLKAKLVVMEKLKREEVLAELRKVASISVEDIRALGEVMLGWHDVMLMRRYGMQFGAHTLSHPSLPNIPRREARTEVVSSKWVLEDRLSEDIRHFSYPNPGNKRHSSPDIAEMLRDAGYSSATTSMPGRVVEGSETFQLKRKGIYSLFSQLPDFYFWIQKESLAEIYRHFGRSMRFSAEKTRPYRKRRGATNRTGKALHV